MPYISLVTLGVDDLERATRFYAALDWRPSSASVPGVVAFFHGTTAALALWGRDELIADARLAPEGGRGFGGVALAVNVESPAAVDGVLERAQSAGGRITKPGERTDWGGYSGYFADPDGHLWEVAHNPFWGLEDGGHLVLPDDG